MAGKMSNLRQQSRDPRTAAERSDRGSSLRSFRSANFRDTEVRALERELENAPTGTGRSAVARAAIEERLRFARRAAAQQRADAQSKRRRGK